MAMMRGVNYGPFRAGQSPDQLIFPTLENLQEDSPLMRLMCNLVRIYSCANGFSEIVNLAAAQGLRTIPGAFLNDLRHAWAPAANATEVSSLINLLNSTNLSNIPFAVVGNEMVTIQHFTVAQVISNLAAVRGAAPSSVQLTSAETWFVYLNNPALAAAVDIIFVNIHPYWESVPVEQAAAFVVEKVELLRAAYPGKPVVISETGWPTGGDAHGAAVPSVANQQLFLAEFMELAKAHNIDYVGFEAFDEPFKVNHEGPVGAHWGLYNEDRTAKADLATFNPWISGGAGDDVLDVGPATGRWLEGLDGADVLIGSAGTDRLFGDAGDDTLNGLQGADRLFGGQGNDVLDGGAGADALLGAAGDDRYIVDTDIDIITELAGEGIDAVNASATYFLFDEVENLTLTGASAINGSGNALANVITGNGAVNQLFGLAGNDTLDGGAGADSLFGGLGDDLYIVDNSADFAFEGNVSWGLDLVQASVSYALDQNIDNLTLVGAALVGNGNLLANVITGNANANTLFGMAGNDTLNGAAGADQMFGGLGDDLYIVDDAADFTFEAQSAWGTDTVQANVDYQLGQNIDNLVLQAGAGGLTGRGNLLANTLTGNESANTLFGFAGNDTLDGGLGGDQLYGREGDDAYIVDNVGDVVAEANAAWGTDTIFASITYFLSPNIEHLTLTGAGNINGSGNGLNNTVIGNSGANNLFGQLGNDTLDGGAGADSLFGGEGDDLYIFDNLGDVGFEASASWGTDLVQASVSHTLGTNLDNLTLTGAAAINGTGNNLANSITGNAAANALFGLGGADTLAGGAGNDALDGGAGDDAFVFAPGSGSDTITGFIAGSVEDTINLSAYSGSGVTWTVTQSGADTVFAFSNGDQIALLNVTVANLVQTDPFGYS